MKVSETMGFTKSCEVARRINKGLDDGVYNKGPKPKEIKKMLDEYVIGQEKSKKVLSVAAYNHRKINDLFGDEISKSNIIMIGPSGSGKTHLVTTLAKTLNVPFVIGNTASFTQKGYVGDDIEELLAKLVAKAYNMVPPTLGYSVLEERVEKAVKLAERGIVFLDEFDKRAAKPGYNGERKNSNTCFQQDILKIVEGVEVKVPIKGYIEGYDNDFVYLNSSKILFIACGAFSGIENIINKRIGGDRNAINVTGQQCKKKEYSYNELIDQVTCDDVMEYGFIQEIVGRFPVICPLHQLSVDDILRILVEPKNNILSQYTRMLEADNIELVFTRAAMKAIAETAMKSATGARGLRKQIEDLLLDIMYDFPDGKYKRVVIEDKDVVAVQASRSCSFC